MKTPKVSVLIVTWNRKDDVLHSVQSVLEQEYANYEVIVVDNASSDGTISALQAAFPSVKLVPLLRNIGASAGRNPGIAIAEGDIVFLLDSDASLARDTLTQVVRKFQTDPALGIITCRVLNAHTGGLDSNTWIFTEKDKAYQEKEFLSFSFTECAAAIRKEVFDRVGPFWDRLFFGREGEELSLRVLDAGYYILYCPTAVVYHHASPLERVAGGNREYLDLRNSLYIGVVYYPWWMLIWGRLSQNRHGADQRSKAPLSPSNAASTV